MTRYSIVLLDADGTLLDYDKAEDYAFTAVCRDLGISASRDNDLSIYRRINAELWHALERGEIDQDTLAVERFQRLLQEIGQEADAKAMAEGYLSHLGEAGFLIPEALELVRDLADRTRLVLITNGLARVQRSRLAASGLERYFTDIIISDEVGVQKPDPAIFERALSPFSGVARAEVLMVGDSLSSDIQGGTNSGIPTCWYNPEGADNPDGPRPTHEIYDLSELRSLI